MDIQEDRLWIVGSHTSTRKKFKYDKGTETNLERLSKVRLRPNRFLIASAWIEGGKLKDDKFTQIPITKAGNVLSLALQEDPPPWSIPVHQGGRATGRLPTNRVEGEWL